MSCFRRSCGFEPIHDNGTEPASLVHDSPRPPHLAVSPQGIVDEGGWLRTCHPRTAVCADTGGSLRTSHFDARKRARTDRSSPSPSTAVCVDTGGSLRTPSTRHP